MTTTEITNGLRAHLRHELEQMEEPNPAAAAEAVFTGLNREQLQSIALVGLSDLARHVLQRMRMRGDGTNNSDRLQSAASARRLDAVALWAGHRQVWLRDCTMTDLTAAGDGYAKQIGALEDRLDRINKLIRQMRKAKVKIAGELPDELLERIWFDA